MNEIKSHIVTEEDKVERIDKYLSKHQTLSRNAIQKLISTGNVKVNDKTCKANHKINPGDKIEVTIPPKKPLSIEKENIPLDILYEDKDVIVLNKPAGVVTHPAVGNFKGTLINGLLYHCPDISSLGAPLRPGVVHRLDKGTSGCLIFAKTDIAYNGLAEQFKKHSIEREYIALVYGNFKTDEGEINKEIGRHFKDRKRMSTRTRKGKKAKSSYKVLNRYNSYTLLKVIPHTGRTHQIRVHLASIGHPVIGDETYGRKKYIEINRQKHIMKRPGLHAKTLGFIHPINKKFLKFEAPLPQDIKKAIEFLENSLAH
jgi:23S rRNA pseudouridine1911/1915/1917 synthase